jgi:hypothetical protein
VKKAISIFMTLLIMAAMFHITVATHFCGGEIAGKLISVTGRLATCGMEKDGDNSGSGEVYFTRHCCEDDVILCQTNNNYFPTFTFLQAANFNISMNPGTSEPFVDFSIIASKPLSTGTGPPGKFLPANVHQSCICVYRI